MKQTILKDICFIKSGKHQPKVDEKKYWDNENGFPWLRIKDLSSAIFKTEKKLSIEGIGSKVRQKAGIFKKNSLVLARCGYVGKVGFLKNDFFASDVLFNLESKNNQKILNKFLYFYFLRNEKKINSIKKGTAQPSITITRLKDLKINLPIIEKQKEIVETLNSLEKYKLLLEEEIKLNKKIFKNKLNYFFKDHNKESEIKLKDICFIKSGKHQPKVDEKKYWDNENGFPWLRIGDLKPETYDTKKKLSIEGIGNEVKQKNSLFKKNTIAFAKDGANIGKVGWLKKNFFASGHLLNIFSKLNSITNNRYLYFYFLCKFNFINVQKTGTACPAFSINQLRNLKINLPNIEKQKEIVETLNSLEKYNLSIEKEFKNIDNIFKKLIKKLII